MIGKHLEPRSHRRFLARPSEAGDRQLDQVRGSFEVLPRERVTNGVVPLAALLVPPTRAPVEVTDAVGLLARDACPEDIGEQVVVSVPLAPSVERDQEEIPSIEVLERALAAVQSGDRIAQGPGEPIEDAGP